MLLQSDDTYRFNIKYTYPDQRASKLDDMCSVQCCMIWLGKFLKGVGQVFTLLYLYLGFLVKYQHLVSEI